MDAEASREKFELLPKCSDGAASAGCVALVPTSAELKQRYLVLQVH